MSFNDLPFFSTGRAPAENGKDGVSPTITVEDISGGHRLTITDVTGKKTIDVFNGLQGPAGPQGLQGEVGPKGETGLQGPQGPAGQTGQSGADGKAGADGKDGVSVTHSWDGTILTITSASGTSSANLKGNTGETGSNGKDGAAGKSAYAYAQEGGYSGTELEFTEVLSNILDKRTITLGLHTDGLLYVFVDGIPVGTGIELPKSQDITT